MKRAELCDLAKQHTTKERTDAYGTPKDCFTDIAARWSLTLGLTITAAQVALCMIDLKMARLAQNHGHQDSWVDIAGYAACGVEVVTEA